MARADHERVGLLASVRSLAEAEEALAAGADLIDMKEPGRGALGAVDGAVLELVVRKLHGLRPVSATVGDLPVDPGVLRIRVEAVAACGVDYVKVGLTCDPEGEAVVENLAPLATSGIPLVAVLPADRGLPGPALIDRLAVAGFVGAMLDTEDKTAGSLCRIVPHQEIAAFCALVRSRGLLLGLAGSLALDDIPVLAPLKPDYLGFRGALCLDGRAGRLDAARVAEARQRLDAKGTGG